MARFRFRLATLLRLREARRDERRDQLGQAEHARRLLEEQTEQIETEMSQVAGEHRSAAQPGLLNVDHLVDMHRHTLALQAQRSEAIRQAALLDKEIGHRREALVAADRDVRVLETLRDKHRVRFRQDQARVEMKVLDESAMHRFFRKETR
jgi:flagellar export protein FliJ